MTTDYAATSWLLIALLFVIGVMNLLRVAAITVFMLAENVLPNGQWLARAGGPAPIGWGTWLMYTAPYRTTWR